jgi:hypothetical protein
MGVRRFRLSDFIQSTNEGGKFYQLCAPANFTPHEIFVVLISVSGWVDPRFMSIENSSDIIRNWTRDLPASTVVPQPTAPPRAPRGTTSATITCCSMLLFSKFCSKKDTIFQHVLDTTIAGTNLAEFRILIFTFTNTYSPAAKGKAFPLQA